VQMGGTCGCTMGGCGCAVTGCQGMQGVQRQISSACRAAVIAASAAAHHEAMPLAASPLYHTAQQHACPPPGMAVCVWQKPAGVSHPARRPGPHARRPPHRVPPPVVQQHGDVHGAAGPQLPRGAGGDGGRPTPHEHLGLVGRSVRRCHAVHVALCSQWLHWT
jgi:hypothetical protein